MAEARKRFGAVDAVVKHSGTTEPRWEITTKQSGLRRVLSSGQRMLRGRNFVKIC